MNYPKCRTFHFKITVIVVHRHNWISHNKQAIQLDHQQRSSITRVKDQYYYISAAIVRQGISAATVRQGVDGDIDEPRAFANWSEQAAYSAGATLAARSGACASQLCWAQWPSCREAKQRHITWERNGNLPLPFFTQTRRGDWEAGNIRFLGEQMNQLRVLLRPSKQLLSPGKSLSHRNVIELKWHG